MVDSLSSPVIMLPAGPLECDHVGMSEESLQAFFFSSASPHAPNVFWCDARDEVPDDLHCMIATGDPRVPSLFGFTASYCHSH